MQSIFLAESWETARSMIVQCGISGDNSLNDYVSSDREGDIALAEGEWQNRFPIECSASFAGIYEIRALLPHLPASIIEAGGYAELENFVPPRAIYVN